MTKVKHVISSIRKCEREANCILVIFKEMVSPEHMTKYLRGAIEAWKYYGMPGKISTEMLESIKQERFNNNEFIMHFPYHEWQFRNMMLNQKVEIDMPLQLSDVILCKIKEEI